MNTHSKSFIETQLPVSKLSKESYKERKSVQSQTLPALGKWWGRKPLILVRAAILGLLMPATDDPKKDREIFLKLLTMDEDGLWQRKNKSIPLKAIFRYLTPREREIWFSADSTEDKPTFKYGIKKAARNELQRIAFMRFTYDKRLDYCGRPEQIVGPSVLAWEKINAHLGTRAGTLSELIKELGKRQLGHIPRIGDAFCGGGSVPFEAARIGCESFGSDLSPVAAMLTWAAINVAGGGEDLSNEVRQVQKEIYEQVSSKVSEWGIEINDLGWQADAYLYCTETICPECGWMVPILPSLLIGPTSRSIARINPNENKKSYDFLIESGVSESELEIARSSGTLKDSSLICPHCHQSTPIAMIRGDRRSPNGKKYGLRQWEKDDIVPRSNDVFQERIYCIRWLEDYKDGFGNERSRSHYRTPDENDIKREQFVITLLRERFIEWQEVGYIPSSRIESGEKTDEPMRTRGWTHWHHLFTPRQLLIHGLFLKTIEDMNLSPTIYVASLLAVGRCCDSNSKLCRWGVGASREMIAHAFYNQALNTLYTFAGRGLSQLGIPWFGDLTYSEVGDKSEIIPRDARSNSALCDYWITDPPYADAINYHELSEFFLAWYDKHIRKLFPEWYIDSKRALAITGSGETFLKSMVDCYKNLSNNMPDYGAQIVMFTHQDTGVWADLRFNSLVIWSSRHSCLVYRY